MTSSAVAMATAKTLVLSGQRANGRWKRGTVTGNGKSANTADSQTAMKKSGVVLDHAPDLIDRSRQRHERANLRLSGGQNVANWQHFGRRQRLDRGLRFPKILGVQAPPAGSLWRLIRRPPDRSR